MYPLCGLNTAITTTVDINPDHHKLAKYGGEAVPKLHNVFMKMPDYAHMTPYALLHTWKKNHRVRALEPMRALADTLQASQYARHCSPSMDDIAMFSPRLEHCPEKLFRVWQVPASSPSPPGTYNIMFKDACDIDVKDDSGNWVKRESGPIGHVGIPNTPFTSTIYMPDLADVDLTQADNRFAVLRRVFPTIKRVADSIDLCSCMAEEQYVHAKHFYNVRLSPGGCATCVRRSNAKRICMRAGY